MMFDLDPDFSKLFWKDPSMTDSEVTVSGDCAVSDVHSNRENRIRIHPPPLFCCYASDRRSRAASAT